MGNEEDQNIQEDEKVEEKESENLEDILGDDKTDSIDELDESIERTRYVINIGKPSWITIREQEHIKYRQEDGREVAVMVLLINDVRDNSDIARQYGIQLDRVQKHYLYFYNGVFKGKKAVPLGHSFQVRDWPHIMKCPIGTNKLDEVFYNLPVGQVVQIERGSDADVLIEKFGYVIETDKGGTVSENNPYFRQIQEARSSITEETMINFNKIVAEMHKIDLKDVPKRTDSAEPITLIRDDSAKDD